MMILIILVIMIVIMIMTIHNTCYYYYYFAVGCPSGESGVRGAKSEEHWCTLPGVTLREGARRARRTAVEERDGARCFIPEPALRQPPRSAPPKGAGSLCARHVFVEAIFLLLFDITKFHEDLLDPYIAACHQI